MPPFPGHTASGKYKEDRDFLLALQPLKDQAGEG